jgi:hypothetical protein
MDYSRLGRGISGSECAPFVIGSWTVWERVDLKDQVSEVTVSRMLSSFARFRRGTAVGIATLMAVGGMLAAATQQAADATPASFTSVNENVDGTGNCQNGNPAVNCNIYAGKQYVWLNGGPGGGALADGSYFFAVLDPSGQAGPNDGQPSVLSDLPGGDAYTNRTFTISGGVVSYSGSHDFDSNKIRLLPYDDTTNPGGVYILAVCSLANGYPVTSHDCKYDAFKVRAVPPPPGSFPGALSLTKDVTASFTRTYSWQITKDVDKTLVKQVGGTATFNYTAGVTRDSGTDSGFTLTGTIYVVNDPAAGAASDVTVTDNPSFDQAGVTANCTIYDPQNDNNVYDNTADMAAGDELDFPYSCALTGATAATTGTNSATVDWTNDDASTDSNVSPPVPFDFTATPTLVDDCVTVTDSFNGANPATTLGTTCTTPTSYHYSKTISIPSYGCLSYSNTAAFTTNTTGATGSAQKTVTVCGPVHTGALTMGYWQNKNGQAIISGQAKTGVCPSTTWLRQYAPFQDLASTSTCAQVAAYDVKIFNAANASGSAMNAMLKAQMLSTAFDVYFSDPALGGNKIGAPAPIGGVAIDLTKVNAAPFSANYVNASAAFGGATSLTVSQILAYAAGQSDVGGVTWYSNVKSTQELAKDTFDAINNQVAFGP